MPKLYHHEQSWQVPGRQDRKATRVDVPSNPATLANWLNARRVPLEGDVFDWLTPGNAAADELLAEVRELQPEQQLSSAPPKPRVAGFCDSCGRSAAGTLKLAQGNDLGAFAEWLETADLWAMQRAIELVREHVARIGKTIDERGTIQ